jgi:superoxide dismutase, Cu-Zn family
MRSDLALILFYASLSVGCSAATLTEDEAAGEKKATATLTPTAGNTASGSMTFTSLGLQVRLNIGITNVTPSSVHAFHLHVGPNCGTDGMQAGARWNPTVTVSGTGGASGIAGASGTSGSAGGVGMQVSPGSGGTEGTAGTQRLGDIGNITADTWGKGAVEILTENWSVGTGALDDVVGRAAILYAEPDPSAPPSADNTSARIACGTIQLAR